MKMTINQGLRAMAGFFVLLSVALGYYVHPGFFLFTAFVGLNLLQSAFTNWCPAMWMLGKAGFRKEAPVDGDGGKACCS
jgi:hypothetical protein